MNKKIMTITFHSRSIFKPDPEIKFQVKDVEEGRDILDIMISNKVPVKRAVMVDFVEDEK